MRKLVLFFLPLFFFFFLINTFAEAGSLVNSMEAKKVVIDEETGEESLIPVEGDVYPGDVIVYILTYENTGEKVIKNLKPVGPVPENTEYVGDSEKSSAEALVEFSMDFGETYEEPPVMYKKVDLEGNEEEAEATPDMYTNVRWTIPLLKAGEKVYLEYRVTVK